MAFDSPPKKSGRLTLNAMQNGGGRFNGVNSIGYGSLGRGAMKPGFFASFLVDARGGKMHGKRHSGVDLIIPPSKVCMPTRITCKLIRKEKLIHPPALKEGEALASRIAELGPVGEKFLGAVLIELPHFASRIDGERELVILRSENGVSWYEHKSETPSEALVKLIENDAEINKEKRVIQIFTADFPRYFVAVTRIHQDSKTVGSSGGTVKSSVSQAVSSFPEGAIGKDIKVGLQVLPVAQATIVRVVGQAVAMSAVTTIEPRRRKFRSPVTLTIPVPKEMQENIRKQKKNDNPAVHILYSITGGNSASQWEDITGSAPLNLVNDCVSFSTIVSARYWLMDCRNLPIPIKAAGEIFQDVVAAPFLAKFYILAKRHSLTEAQVRVLCITDDDIESTLERQEYFAIIGSTKDVEVFEGKPYFLDIAGNFKPVSASGQELLITFRSFRVNRLSFVARIVDASQPPTAQLFLNKELTIEHGKRLEPPLFSLDASLPNFDAGLVSPDLEPEQWRAKLEAAKLSLAQDRPPVGTALKLTDIAEALQGDWVPLAAQLGISPREVVKIQTEYGSAPEQAILMLHLWVEKHGGRATGFELERALRKISRDDVIDQCLYDKSDPASGITDDHDSLNPIDSSFYHQDQSIHSENVQVSKREIQPHPYVEVEEGVEYQVEEVWDGTQWHKTRIAVQKPEESAEPTTAVDLAFNGDVISSSLPEKSEEIFVESVPGSYLTAVKEEEINDSLKTEDDEQPLEVKSSVQVFQSEELPSQVAAQIERVEVAEPQPEFQSNNNWVTENESDLRDASGDAENESDLSAAGHPDTLDQLEHFQHRVDNLTIENQLVSQNSEEISHSEHVVTMEPTQKTDAEIHEHEDSSVPSSDDASVKITSNVSVGDPKVTTEVEEFEETLDDGSVIKRQVTKTKQEQLVTESFTVSGPEDVNDSINSQQILHHLSTDDGSSSGPRTVVVETEETLEDGTVVKHTVTKTTEQRMETEETL